MTTNTEIVAAAREYTGTPFHHCGRAKGLGVDCIGLVSGVAKQFDITHHDLEVYSPHPDGVTLVREFDKCLEKIATDDALAGDIAVFWYRDPTKPCHAGIFTPSGIIHTFAVIGRVVEHRIDDYWKKRIVHSYRYPGIEFTDKRKLTWQL